MRLLITHYETAPSRSREFDAAAELLHNDYGSESSGTMNGKSA